MTSRTRIAALLVTPLLVLAGCGSDDTGADQRPASGSTKHQSPSGEESPSESSQPGDGQTTVPLYFTGDTPQGTRLYREFRRVDSADALGAALTLAASGDALDPDYGTLLPSGTFSTSGGAAIPLPDDSWTRLPEGMSESDALVAVQQLVYTAQGVLQSRDPITFTDSSGAATQIFGIASEDGFTAADPIKTLSLVNVTAPEEGATVSGSFTASGVSSSFEATTPWEVRDSSGKAVLQGSAMADGWMDKLYPWETDVDVSGLEPGQYTFAVMTDDPSGGEGPGPMVDTKSITVQ
ncbi:Gmad2 immunoglobulin-like domain-containing protein [Nocardioides aquiterrae]|uniref:GerMN domain-containing protein n=1 Tax=Nocardioides aquiterrae TaxID=203799 RepID=A0ABP4F4M5_9ACTN